MDTAGAEIEVVVIRTREENVGRNGLQKVLVHVVYPHDVQLSRVELEVQFFVRTRVAE